jgi:hypothetical protein
MRRVSDHAELARRYFNCAEASVERADLAIGNKDRTYHVLTAQQYLSLAEKELVAARRRKAKRRPVSARKAQFAR